MESVESFFKKMKEDKIKEIEVMGTTLFDELITKAQVATLPEYVFTGYFLPRFIGKETSPNWVSEWIAIAGTPTSSVDIIDNIGEVLFRVPPIIDTSAIRFNETGSNMSSIMSIYQQQSNNLPMLGTRYLMGALHDKGKELVENDNIDMYRQQWSFILNRYGITNEEVTASDEESTQQSLDDFISY